MVVNAESARARGTVTLTLARPDGTVVERRVQPNATLNAYMAPTTRVFYGAFTTFSPVLTHMSVGDAGVTVETFETATGWSGTPVLDTSSFREGTGSLRRQVSAGTSQRMTSPAKTLDLSAAGSIEVSVKVDVRSRLDTTSEALRFTTSTNNYATITWAQIETYNAGALVDNSWTRVLVPKAAFTEAGTFDWDTITSIDWVAAANLNGILTTWMDDLRLVPTTWSTTPVSATVENEINKRALDDLDDLGTGVVRAQAFWTTSQIVGTHRLFGLYGNSGANLAAVVALDTPLYKSNLLTLTVEWDLSIIGS